MTNIVLIIQFLMKIFDIIGKISEKVDEKALRNWNESLDKFVTDIPEIKTPADAALLARRAHDLISGMRRPKN